MTKRLEAFPAETPNFPRRGETADPWLAMFEHRLEAAESALANAREQFAKDISDARQDAAERVARVHEHLADRSKFNRWIVGIVLTIGMALTGLAYHAYRDMAARMTEVSDATGVRLAAVEGELRVLTRIVEQGLVSRTPPAP